MKSIVFSFKNRAEFERHTRGFSLNDFKYFFKRYGVHVFFVVTLLTGLVMGAICAGNADKTLLNSLDFLFTTNLDARLKQGAFEIFCACFASDFVFLTAVFLVGFAPWGIPVLPFIVMFKGFGTGLTAGWLISIYALKGAGFYLVVLLPGTFLFCLALIIMSSYSFGFSKDMFLLVASRNAKEISMHKNTVIFCSRSMSALIMTFCAAIMDTALWSLLSKAFNF